MLRSRSLCLASSRSISSSQDFLQASLRWRERLALDVESTKADLVPLDRSEWDALLQKIKSPFTKEWLESQTGVIRVPNSLVSDIAPELPGYPSTAESFMLLRLDADADPSEGGFLPPSKHWHALANVRSETAHRVQGVKSVTDAVDSYLSSCYTFDRYQTQTPKKAESSKPLLKLYFPNLPKESESLMGAIYWAQDLISAPANYLTPGALQQAAHDWTNSVAHVEIETVVGDNLLSFNGSLSTHYGCGMIHTVGRGAQEPDREPRLIMLRYRPPETETTTTSNTPSASPCAPIALVGKGVTFDTGGLNLKSGENMLNMKKDMGGAALALGLMRVLVERNFPNPIDCWIPAVENVMDGNSYRPGDILTSVNGTTTEIGNTDAEGRLILADALALASATKPDMILDFATLTGAQRVALGLDIPAVFGNDPKLIPDIMKAAGIERDPIWQLPLWEGYRHRVKSKLADYRNVPSDGGMGGAITAALFLSEFVDRDIPWLHIDFNGLDKNTGLGQAQTLRTLNRFIWSHYVEDDISSRTNKKRP